MNHARNTSQKPRIGEDENTHAEEIDAKSFGYARIAADSEDCPSHQRPLKDEPCYQRGGNENQNRGW